MSSTHLNLDKITKRNVQSIAKMETAALKGSSVGEQVANKVATAVGSWTFLCVQSAILIAWIVFNVARGQNSWDPYPFVLLNLVLSVQAAFSMPIILMAENRQSRLADRRNHLDLQINLLAEQENTELLRLIRLLCQKSGINIQKDEEQGLEQATDPDQIIRQIIETVEHRPDAKQQLDG